MAAIEHIVLDVGRVLIHWDPEIPYKRLIPDPEERQYFLSEVCSPAWNLEQDRGRPFAEAEQVLVAEHPVYEPLIKAYRTHWMEMIPHPILGSMEIMAELIDGGTDVTLLTNFSQETFPLAQSRFPTLSRARGVTVSGEIGLLKPDLEIYRHHHDSFGLDPAATVFFDDSPKNVDGAKAAGWQAFLFTSAEKMRQDMQGLGVKI